MKRVLTLILTIISLNVFAFQDDKIFLDENFNPISDLNGAKYYRTVQQNDENTFYTEVFYLTDRPQMKGSYLDEELTILHGLCIYFHKNGKVESKGIFDHGKRTGIWERFDLFGEKKADRFYPSEKEIKESNRKQSCLAKFQDGAEDLKDYEKANLKFPYQGELLDLTEGEVIINLSINNLGIITANEILSSSAFIFNKPAQNFVKSMPNWNPALWNGKAIVSNFIIKIEFDQETKRQKTTAFQN